MIAVGAGARQVGDHAGRRSAELHVVLVGEHLHFCHTRDRQRHQRRIAVDDLTIIVAVNGVAGHPEDVGVDVQSRAVDGVAAETAGIAHLRIEQGESAQIAPIFRKIFERLVCDQNERSCSDTVLLFF